jgi:alcohol dehydrogenase class IV
LSVIPTTIGSGSEASRYFVLFQQDRKIASRAWQAVPRLVVLDPDLLTYLTPVTARIQLFDCWTHLTEVTLAHLELSPIVWFQLDGIKQHLMNFVKSTKNLEDDSTRLDLQIFSYFGGVSISNTRTGALHTVGEALASQVAIPHVWSLYFSAIHWHELIQGEQRNDKNSVISQKTEELHKSLNELNYWLDLLRAELPKYLKLNQQDILNFDFQKFEKMVLLDKVLWDKEHPVDVSVKGIRNYLELTWNEVVKYGLESTD